MGDDWRQLLGFRCTCCGNCCREPIVLVTDEDIRRIVAHTGQEAVEVVRFFKPKDITWSKRNPGWIRLTPGRRIMGLRQNRRGCQYLGKDERCTIYEHRPVTCRRYPFDVEFDEQGNIARIGVSKSVECPYALDGYTALGQIKALCTWEDEEETPYYKKVKAWNRKREIRGGKAFLQHLGF